MAGDGRYRLGDTLFDPRSPKLQDILVAAHNAKQRPVCLCANPHPEMYVAQTGSGLILKRMPGTGHDHDPHCHSFDAPPEVSGLGHVTGKAILADDNGTTALKLGFPISIQGSRVMPPVASGDGAKSAVQPATKLSLLSLLHYLWEAAELTKWRPAMLDKRNWWIVRRELLDVASRSNTRTLSLSKILYIPPPFRPDNKDQIEQERRTFMHALRPEDKIHPLGILIGEYKAQVPTAYGRKITIKHMPDFPFFMDEQLCKRFDRLLEEKIEDNEAYGTTHLILIATFSAREHRADIREIAGMLITNQWLPFDHERELDMLDSISSRSFLKCLRYNLGSTAAVASALLVDTTPPTALFVPPTTGMTTEKIAAMKTIASEGVYPHWIWDTAQAQMPAIPDPGHVHPNGDQTPAT